MTFEKKLLIVKIFLFIGIVGISAYLWFIRPKTSEVIYTDGTILKDEESIDSYSVDSEKLFDYYLKDENYDLTAAYIDEDGNEKYYGAIYTELFVYYSNNPYKIYLLTKDSGWYLNNCDTLYITCMLDSDKFLAINNSRVLDVTDQVKIYYSEIVK